MTREEILGSQTGMGRRSFYHENDALEAMSIWGKNESIGFAQWVEKNYSFSLGTYEAIDPVTARVLLPRVEYTTEELYTIYQEQNK